MARKRNQPTEASFGGLIVLWACELINAMCREQMARSAQEIGAGHLFRDIHQGADSGGG